MADLSRRTASRGSWRTVPLGRLSRWERLVERVTGWTRMGIAQPFGRWSDEWNNRYWDREVGRG